MRIRSCHAMPRARACRRMNACRQRILCAGVNAVKLWPGMLTAQLGSGSCRQGFTEKERSTVITQVDHQHIAAIASGVRRPVVDRIKRLIDADEQRLSLSAAECRHAPWHLRAQGELSQIRSI